MTPTGGTPMLHRIAPWLSLAVLTIVAVMMASPALAADNGSPTPLPDGPTLSALPLGVVAVSFVMTGIGYALNYALPFLKTDAQKGIAHVVYQAVGVAAFEVATSSNFGLNKETGAAFVVALGTFGFSHGLLYKPTTWAAKLGAGRNKDGSPPGSNVVITGQGGRRA